VDKDEALKLALEALQWNWGGEPLPTLELQAINAIKEALAQPDQESDDLTIAYMSGFHDGKNKYAPQPEQEPVACPFPCGWKRLFEIIVADGAFLARSLEEGEAITEHQREVVMHVIGYAKDMALHGMETTPPQRKPLPPQSPCEMTQAEGKMFKLGWLECEAAHGIKGE